MKIVIVCAIGAAIGVGATLLMNEFLKVDERVIWAISGAVAAVAGAYFKKK